MIAGLWEWGFVLCSICVIPGNGCSLHYSQPWSQGTLGSGAKLRAAAEPPRCPETWVVPVLMLRAGGVGYGVEGLGLTPCSVALLL